MNDSTEFATPPKQEHEPDTGADTGLNETVKRTESGTGVDETETETGADTELDETEREPGEENGDTELEESFQQPIDFGAVWKKLIGGLAVALAFIIKKIKKYVPIIVKRIDTWLVNVYLPWYRKKIKPHLLKHGKKLMVFFKSFAPGGEGNEAARGIVKKTGYRLFRAAVKGYTFTRTYRKAYFALPLVVLLVFGVKTLFNKYTVYSHKKEVAAHTSQRSAVAGAIGSILDRRLAPTGSYPAIVEKAPYEVLSQWSEADWNAFRGDVRKHLRAVLAFHRLFNGLPPGVEAQTGLLGEYIRHNSYRLAKASPQARVTAAGYVVSRVKRMNVSDCLELAFESHGFLDPEQQLGLTVAVLKEHPTAEVELETRLLEDGVLAIHRFIKDFTRYVAADGSGAHDNVARSFLATLYGQCSIYPDIRRLILMNLERVDGPHLHSMSRKLLTEATERDPDKAVRKTAELVLELYKTSN